MTGVSVSSSPNTTAGEEMDLATWNVSATDCSRNPNTNEKGPFFHTIDRQRVPAIQPGPIQTKRRHEDVKMGVRHVRQKSKSLILYRRMTESTGVTAWSVMLRPYIGLMRSALFERRMDTCLGSKHVKRSRVMIGPNLKSHMLGYTTHSSCLLKLFDSTGYHLNRKRQS